jgi:hypothetical protein
MSNELEKDLNDEVYEDSFYDNEEELDEDEEEEETSEVIVETKEAEAEDDEVDDGETRIAMSFACDDCDYRWDDVIIRAKDNFNEDDDYSATCPMCGSMNVSQI